MKGFESRGAGFGEALAAPVDRLWADQNVLAIAVTGSVATGTASAGSDIDLFVIEKGEGKVWESVYLREAGVLVHLQYLSAAQLAELAPGLGGRPFNRAVGTARLLRVRDDTVAGYFRQASELKAADRDLRILEAAGNACFALYRVEKLLNASDGTGLSAPIDWRYPSGKLAENLAKIVLFTCGEMPGRDPVAEAASYDAELSGIVRPVLGDPAASWPEGARRLADLAAARLDRSLGDWSRPVLDFLRAAGRPYSVDDLENTAPFDKLATDFERLMIELCRRGLVQEGSRPFKPTLSPAPVAEEVVYTRK